MGLESFKGKFIEVATTNEGSAFKLNGDRNNTMYLLDIPLPIFNGLYVTGKGDFSEDRHSCSVHRLKIYRNRITAMIDKPLHRYQER